MRRSTLAICALLMVATSGCDQVDTAKAKLKLAWDKLRGRSTQQSPPPPTAPARPSGDTAAPRVAAEERQTASKRPRPPAAPQGQALTRRGPSVSDDTGAGNPG